MSDDQDEVLKKATREVAKWLGVDITKGRFVYLGRFIVDDSLFPPGSTAKVAKLESGGKRYVLMRKGMSLSEVVIEFVKLIPESRRILPGKTHAQLRVIYAMRLQSVDWPKVPSDWASKGVTQSEIDNINEIYNNWLSANQLQTPEVNLKEDDIFTIRLFGEGQYGSCGVYKAYVGFPLRTVLKSLRDYHISMGSEDPYSAAVVDIEKFGLVDAADVVTHIEEPFDY